MMDPIRRKVVEAGVAVTAMSVIPRVFAQQSGTGEKPVSSMKEVLFASITRRPVPVSHWLLIPGGGLSSTISFFQRQSPFNAIEEFKGQYHCITADCGTPQRQVQRPVEVDRPWESFADDQLGLMDHLGIDKFT